MIYFATTHTHTAGDKQKNHFKNSWIGPLNELLFVEKTFKRLLKLEDL